MKILRKIFNACFIGETNATEGEMHLGIEVCAKAWQIL